MNTKKYFISAVKQIIIYWLLFLILYTLLSIVFIENINHVFIQILICLLMPFVAGIIWCYIQNSKEWKMQGTLFLSQRVKRIAIRVLPVLCYLVLARITEKFDMGNWLSSQFNFTYEIIPYLLCNFNVALIVAIFPLSYDIIEFLFVRVK